MKKILMALGIAVLAIGFGSTPAEAARMGGGKSFGMQRQAVSPKPATPPTAAPAPANPGATPAPAPATPKRSWMGPLAGLAAGLGIGALLSHFGLGEGMANILMIALLVFAALAIVRLIAGRKSAPAQSSPLQYAGMGAGDAPRSAPDFAAAGAAATGNASASEAANATASIPAGFDAEGFVRVAKLNFVRLQAANDSGNLEDLREFLAPEVFAEIKLQLDERGPVAQQTDVVTLNAELLEVVTEGQRHIASVHFSGMLRESAGAPAVPFSEVWHLVKPIDDSRGWAVAGIQQLN